MNMPNSEARKREQATPDSGESERTCYCGVGPLHPEEHAAPAPDPVGSTQDEDVRHEGVLWGISHPGAGPSGCSFCAETLRQQSPDIVDAFLAGRAAADRMQADAVEAALAQALAPFRLLVRTWRAASKNGPVWALVLRELDVAIRSGELRAAARARTEGSEGQ